MSIFESIFGGAKQPQQAAQPQTPPTNNPAQNQPPQPAHSSAGAAPNGVIPPEGNKGSEQSPLDKFNKLWETEAPSKENDPAQNQGPTPQQMMEAATKVDFSRVIDPENLKKIVAGGEDAATALVAILNKHGQTVYGQSAVVAQKLVEKAVEQAELKFAEKVPDLVRRHSARDSLVSENPAFKDPAVSTLVEMVQSQLTLKYPNASASELKQLAQEYFTGAATKLAPPKKSESNNPSRKKDAEVDWDDWFKTPTPNPGDF